MQQLVKEIFKDYKQENSLTLCQIISINLYKKTNKLELKLQAKAIIMAFAVLLFLYYLSFSIYTIAILYLIICVYIGFRYHDWKSRNLVMRDYEFLGTIGGKNKKQAKLDFLEKLNNNYQEKDKLEQKIY